MNKSIRAAWGAFYGSLLAIFVGNLMENVGHLYLPLWTILVGAFMGALVALFYFDRR